MKARRFLIFHLDLDFFITNRAIRVIDTVTTQNGKEQVDRQYEITFHVSQMMMAQFVVKRNDMLHEQLWFLHQNATPSPSNDSINHADDVPYGVWDDVSREFLYDAMVVDMKPTGPSSDFVALPQQIIIKQEGKEDVCKNTFISMPPKTVLYEIIYGNGFTITGVPLDKHGLFKGYNVQDVGRFDVTLVPFVASASMSRTGEYLFVNKALAPALMERLSLGLFSMDKITGSMQATDLIAQNKSVIMPAKVSAYLGLSLSDITSVPEGLAKLKENGATEDELTRLEQILTLTAEKTVCVRDINYSMMIEELAPWCWMMHEFKEPFFYDDDLSVECGINQPDIDNMLSVMKNISEEYKRYREKKQLDDEQEKSIWCENNRTIWEKCLMALMFSLLKKTEDVDYDTVLPKISEAQDDDSIVFAAAAYMMVAFIRGTVVSPKSYKEWPFDLKKIQKAITPVREYMQKAFSNQNTDRNTLRNVFSGQQFMVKISWHAEQKKLVFGVDENVSSRTYIPRMTAAKELQAYQLLNALYKSVPAADGCEKACADGTTLREYWTEANRTALVQESRRTAAIGTDRLYARIESIVNTPTVEELQTAVVNHGQEIIALHKAYKKKLKFLIPRTTPAVELKARQLLNALYKSVLAADGRDIAYDGSKTLHEYWKANCTALVQESRRTAAIGTDRLYARIQAIVKQEPDCSLDNEKITAENLKAAAAKHGDEIIALHKTYKKRELKSLYENVANASDGSGFASEAFFTALEKVILPKKELENPKGQRLNAVIFRMPWLKGVLVRLDWKKYIREEAGLSEDEPLEIRDRFGVVRDMKDCEVLFFDSMFKGGALFNDKALDDVEVRKQLKATNDTEAREQPEGMNDAEAREQPEAMNDVEARKQPETKPSAEEKTDIWAFFWKKMKDYGFMPGIAGKNSAPAKTTHMNYQFVSTNGLSKNMLGEMVSKELNHAVKLYENPKKFVHERWITAAAGNDDNATDDLRDENVDANVDATISQNPDTNDNDNENFNENRLLLQIMEKEKKFGKSKYMRSKILKDLQSLLLNQTRARLEVEGDVRLIVGDLDLQIKHIAANYVVVSGKEKPKVTSPINDLSENGYGVGYYYAPGNEDSPWRLGWTKKLLHSIDTTQNYTWAEEQWNRYRERFGYLLRWYSDHERKYAKSGEAKSLLYRFMDAWIEEKLTTDQKWFAYSNLKTVKELIEKHPAVSNVLSIQGAYDLLKAVVYNIDASDPNKAEIVAWGKEYKRFGNMMCKYHAAPNQSDMEKSPKLYACLEAWIKAIDGDVAAWWQTASFAKVVVLCRENEVLFTAVKEAAAEMPVMAPIAQAAVVLRNPHLCQGEDAVVMPLDDETWTRYDNRYRHLDGLVFVGNLTMNFINGADTDGDRAHLVSDGRVLESVEAANKANMTAIWRVLQNKQNLINAIKKKEQIVTRQRDNAKNNKEKKAKEELLNFYNRIRRVLNMMPNLADTSMEMDKAVRQSVTIPPVFSGSGQAAVKFCKGSDEGQNMRAALLKVFELSGQQMIGLQSLNALDLAATSYGVRPNSSETEQTAAEQDVPDEQLTRKERDMLHDWYGICLMVGSSLSTAIEIDLAKTTIRGKQSALMMPSYIDEQQIAIITSGSKSRKTPTWSGYRAFHHVYQSYMNGMSYKDRVKWRNPDPKSIDDTFTLLLKGQDEYCWKTDNQRYEFALDTLPAVVEEQWQRIKNRVNQIITPENGKPDRMLSFFADPIDNDQVNKILFAANEPTSSALREGDLWIEMKKGQDGTQQIVYYYDGKEWNPTKDDPALTKKVDRAIDIRSMITKYLQEVKKRTDRQKNAAKYSQRYLNIMRYFLKEYPLSEACELLDVFIPKPEKNTKQVYATGLSRFVEAKEPTEDRTAVLEKLNNMLCGIDSEDKSGLRKTMEAKLAMYYHAQNDDERLELLKDWINKAGGKLHEPMYVPTKEEIQKIETTYKPQIEQMVERQAAVYAMQFAKDKAIQQLAKKHAEEVRKEMRDSVNAEIRKQVDEEYAKINLNDRVEQRKQTLKQELIDQKQAQYESSGKKVDRKTIEAQVQHELNTYLGEIMAEVKNEYEKQKKEEISTRKEKEFMARISGKKELAEQNGDLNEEYQSVLDSNAQLIARLKEANRNARYQEILRTKMQQELAERSRKHITTSVAEEQLSDEKKTQKTEDQIKLDEDYRRFVQVLVDRPQGVLLLKQLLHYEKLNQLMREDQQSDAQVPNSVNGLYDHCRKDPELLYQVTYSMLRDGAISEFLFIHLNRSLLVNKLKKR